MADLNTTCAVLVWFLELILFLQIRCGVLPPSELSCIRCIKDAELWCSFLGMAMALAPMVQAVARANKVPLWRSILSLALSAATVYCTSVEFVGAFHRVNLVKELLPCTWFPLVIASVVLIARVIEKRHPTLGELPSGGSRGGLVGFFA